MKLLGRPEVVSLFKGRSTPDRISTLNLHEKLMKGSDAGREWNISSSSNGFSSSMGSIYSPTSFKFTMNLPTVTVLSLFRVNFKCCLTPVPLMSVKAVVNGPSANEHSPSNLAYP